MLWKEQLDNWLKEKYFKYPKDIKENFLWNTSVIEDINISEFKQKFKIDDTLPIKQDYSPYIKYIKNPKNKYATYFYNPSKDTLLVIPLPYKNNNYATLKYFCDNAPKIQQKKFWILVSKLIYKLIKKHTKIYVSSHGFGVHYFHLRISIKPKYYFDKELSNT